MIAEVTTRVLWQEPGSIVRRKWRGPVRLTDTELVGQREGKPPTVRIPLSEVSSVETVDALTMRKAYHRPFRSRVLRIESERADGTLVVGVVLRDPEPWRAAIAAAIDRD